ncbi:TPA: Stp1/IreP family PP2C-type Ser/Thr phosphatase [Candidatus Poribacteria bacterium]|nr:Stp1/IreP family PP2C-type Ser/Thr phosphatase [Candidatus Poribacteria bacterium]HIA68575.1 Stp1/IreP family PP2C-type Ser/Thr phosphatase [Candidatus Poribacteria bacterium]HIB91255.1 Stp1/IreP family PP2C-type Ser/Thr phosphatase [Candidatus Poribacteria bacterium]HIC03128.1 Stp1/IreP family PP2C-type Ser/Thr phosphatase [Candidatus Poribacteria bacterium]HIC19378.1 Stp1/IreP family PP2C-type Ser/Thr phosphatase [Candidatus Poribacteria bacterium]
MKFVAQTDVGKRRSHNEDCYLIDDKISLFVIADGMGGHNAGNIASQLAVDVFREWTESFSSTDLSISKKANIINQLVVAANTRIYTESKAHPNRHGMGTTLIAGICQDNLISYVHIGDSRIYLIRQGEISQTTIDHSHVQEMVDDGIITAKEARVHPNRHIINRAVGLNQTVVADTDQFEILTDDILLVCTDGLHDMIASDREIAELIISSPDLKSAGKALTETALHYGGSDNITLILIQIT